MNTKIDETGDFKPAFNDGGLIAAIAVDHVTKEVYMMAWMNKDALIKTIETGIVHYWSRSRQKLWKKGETSGNVQHVKSIKVDCDQDALLIEIEQVGGGACHTGRKTCFYRELDITTKKLKFS